MDKPQVRNLMRRGRVRFALSLLLFLAVIGCARSHTVNVARIGGVEIVNAEGTRFEIGPGDTEHAELIQWLTDNKAGWHEYLATRPGGEILISGEGFYVEVIGNSAFLLDTSADQRIVLFRDISAEERAFFERISTATETYRPVD